MRRVSPPESTDVDTHLAVCGIDRVGTGGLPGIHSFGFPEPSAPADPL
jgi:hypothetical protein